MDEIVLNMKKEAQTVLETNILSYWMRRMTNPRGGFYGRIDGHDNLVPGAEKGAVMNARILWTFSAAYRLLKKDEYLEMATRAKRELIDRFYDKEFGGVYWSIDAQGNPLDTKKQIYALGFAIYGLSEYYRATGDKEALEYAIRLFHDIEDHSFDGVKNGYCEALSREWNEMADMRLSDKDANERKTMNTHLHVLEPYTNLFRIWKNGELQEKLRNLIYLFIHHIMDGETGHLQLFFDDDWQSKYSIISYGHDIEASWLLYEAADVLGDEAVLDEVKPVAAHIAEASVEGFLPEGGMMYELHADSGAVDADRHWWVQAEAIVGFINMWQLSGNPQYLERANHCWDFVKRHLIDFEHGEWFWSLRADGTQNKDDDKAGFWKCPYHNGRMCMEILERSF